LDTLRFEPPWGWGRLDATYAVQLRLIGKLLWTVDFLLVNIDWKSEF